MTTLELIISAIIGTVFLLRGSQRKESPAIALGLLCIAVPLMHVI